MRLTNWWKTEKHIFPTIELAFLHEKKMEDDTIDKELMNIWFFFRDLITQQAISIAM